MSVQPKKRNWLLITLLTLLVIVAGIAIYKGTSKPKGKAVTIEEATKRTIKETVSASGKIFPETEVKISSDVSGEIVELYVIEGDSVVAGQVLAKINPDSYISAVERGEASLNGSKSQLAISRSQIESNKAQKEQIVAQLENARTIHKRNIQLKTDGVISQAELDQSWATLRQLEANLRSAEASIKSAQQNSQASEFSIKGADASLKELKTSLSRTTIKSPTSGIVSKLSVEKGERVVGTIQMTGTEMMRISNLNAMEVQVDVSENDILKVKMGDIADIEVDAYIGKKFQGTVTQIANSASNIASTSSASLNTDQVTNFIVKIRIDENSYQDIKTKDMKYPLRPGMSASVDIYTDEVKDVIAVPIQCVTVREKDDAKGNKKKAAVKNDESSTDTTPSNTEYDEVVFLMVADTVKMVKVEIGIQDDEYIMIKSGVKVGDKLISGPYNEVSKTLKSGEKVRVKDDKEDKKK
ncbi:MAG: efflux RND transporter periplasmic adaptor subunit [Saprospiraceae bacterium]|jgi:HlyD family secretion protein|nr:efflux RND transporter periplasmic adaptor subunit [Saprospiraceae bacterium]